MLLRRIPRETLTTSFHLALPSLDWPLPEFLSPNLQ